MRGGATGGPPGKFIGAATVPARSAGPNKQRPAADTAGPFNHLTWRETYFFSFAFALASSLWLRKPSLSVSSLVNCSERSESELLSERRLHQCFFSPLVELSVLAALVVSELLLLSDAAAEPEAVNSAREMRPSESVSRLLYCDAPGPNEFELAFVSALTLALEELTDPLVVEFIEPEVEPVVLPEVVEDGEVVVERVPVEPELLPLPVLELPVPALPVWASALTVSNVRPLSRAAKVRE